ncbi:MAG: hypothetical protein ACJ74G_13615 [Blastocatellia bacterium]
MRDFSRKRRLAQAAIAPQHHQLILFRRQLVFQLDENVIAILVVARNERNFRPTREMRMNRNGRRRGPGFLCVSRR